MLLSKLSTAERKKLKPEDFADSKNKLFPILDQDDVDSAASLIGKAKNPDAVKKKIIAIAKRKKLKIPDAWKGSDSSFFSEKSDGGVEEAETAIMEFTLEVSSENRQSEDGYIVYPNSIVWRAGKYAEGEFPPEYLYVLCQNFDKPVAGNIQHTDFMKGKACILNRVWIDEQDSEILRGEVLVNSTLDKMLSDSERKLSVEIDLLNDAIFGLAMCTNPRVEDAALMINFASVALTEIAEFKNKKSHDTSTGKYAIQRLHDISASSGAVCKNPNSMNSKTEFISKHESQLLQSVHDMTLEHGAACDDGSKSSSYLWTKPKNTNRANNSSEKEDMNKGLLIAAFAEMGLITLSAKCARLNFTDEDNSSKELAKAVKEELDLAVNSDPIRVAIMAAGVKDESEVTSLIGLAAFGKTQDKAVRENCKKLAIRAYGEEEAKIHYTTIDSGTSQFVESLCATFEAVGDHKLGIKRNDPADRQTAPSNDGSSSKNSDEVRAATVEDKDFDASKFLAMTEHGQKILATAGNGKK